MKKRMKSAMGRIYGSDILPIGTIVTLVFALCDLACLFILIDKTFKDLVLITIAISMALALVLDVPMNIAGSALKRYIQGTLDRKSFLIVLVLSVSAFAVVFIPYCIFRLTSDIGINPELLGIETTSNYGGASEMISASDVYASASPKPELFVAKFVLSIIPFGTSIASFCAGFYFTDSIKSKAVKAAEVCADYREEINRLKRKLANKNAAHDYMTFHTAHEKDVYYSFICRLKAENIAMKQEDYIKIMERLRSPDSISEVTDYANSIVQAIGDDDLPHNAAGDLLESLIPNNTEQNTDGFPADEDIPAVDDSECNSDTNDDQL